MDRDLADWAASSDDEPRRVARARVDDVPPEVREARLMVRNGLLMIVNGLSIMWGLRRVVVDKSDVER